MEIFTYVIEGQLEHREVALAIMEIFEREMPNVYEAAFT